MRKKVRGCVLIYVRGCECVTFNNECVRGGMKHFMTRVILYVITSVQILYCARSTEIVFLLIYAVLVVLYCMLLAHISPLPSSTSRPLWCICLCVLICNCYFLCLTNNACDGGGQSIPQHNRSTSKYLWYPYWPPTVYICKWWIVDKSAPYTHTAHTILVYFGRLVSKMCGCHLTLTCLLLLMNREMPNCLNIFKYFCCF